MSIDRGPDDAIDFWHHPRIWDYSSKAVGHVQLHYMDRWDVMTTFCIPDPNEKGKLIFNPDQLWMLAFDPLKIIERAWLAERDDPPPAMNWNKQFGIQ